jgi:hypothetical protein
MGRAGSGTRGVTGLPAMVTIVVLFRSGSPGFSGCALRATTIGSSGLPFNGCRGCKGCAMT